MNFKLTKEQENFKMRVREITEKYVTPYAAENDKPLHFQKFQWKCLEKKV